MERYSITGRCPSHLRLWVLGPLLALAVGAAAAFASAGQQLDDAARTAGRSPLSNPQSTRPASFDRAVLVPVHGEITDITRDSIRRRFKTVREQGDKLVVLDLNTPGGMVTSTLEICNEIRKLQDEGVSVYAWVNDKAYSGGAIIALAATGIVMAPNATIGDSQMILMTPEGVSAVPEDLQPKMTSPLLAELRDSARRNGYSMELLLALIQPEVEVYWVENSATGERRFVSPARRDELFGTKDKDKADAGKSDWHYVESAPGLPGVPHQPIDGPKELLTLRTPEALAYGLAMATAGNESELASLLNITGPLQSLSTTWMEAIAGWLASPMVRGVLFLIMMLGAYAEFKTPGVGLPGGVALIALLLFLGAPYAAGFTVTWEIIVVLLGILLLVVEAFVIPGFGVAGIAGLILLGIGLIASFVPKQLPGPDSSGFWPMSPLSIDYLRRGLWALACGTSGSLVGMYLLARILPKVPVVEGLIPPNPTRNEVEVDDPYGGLAHVGHIGRSEGPLRPAGKARFGALLVDVVSDGEFIAPDTRVEVIERAGSRVVVRRVD